MNKKQQRSVSGCDSCDNPEKTSVRDSKKLFSFQKAIRVLTPVSGLLLVIGFFSKYLFVQDLSTIFYISSIIAGSLFVIRNAVKGLIKQRFLNISFLVLIASIGAIYIGEYAEAAAVVFFFSLAELFESYGVERSRRAVSALLKRTPKVARLKNGNSVPVVDVMVGQIVEIRPGEQIPLDGTVINGESAVDESAITGESVPVDKSLKDKVFAGTLNAQGYLEVQVDKLSTDSTFSKIISLIEEAQASRAPTQAFIDNFAKYYTPTIVLTSVFIAVIPTLVFGLPFDDWLYRALILLVIACPCALVISTPVAIASAIGGASRNGILVKGGKYLEKLATIKAIGFDKTRTITYGRHIVTDVLVFGSYSKKELLTDAASIEALSSHPLAEAIVEYATRLNIELHTIDSFRNIAGKGGSAACLDCEANIHIGNSKLMQEQGIDSTKFESDVELLEKEGKTVVLVAKGNKLMGALGISDVVREGAAEAIADLKDMGIERVMLTGDNEHSAHYIASLVGITDVNASLLPQEKMQIIKKMKESYGPTMMIGDGVNDAPSLATSDVGIAIGDGGTDVAIESADITLLSGDLKAIPKAIRLAKATVRTIHINIALALGIKVLFLVLVPLGFTNLVFAIAADSGMAIVVILNSLRLYNT